MIYFYSQLTNTVFQSFNMKANPTSPQVVIPPPVIFIVFFLISLWLQNWKPLDKEFFRSLPAMMVGYAFLLVSIILGALALKRFFQTRNTVITMKPATSLQTTGIYAFSRNPMYTGLLFLYTGLALLAGNWWTIFLIPVAIFIIQVYVIKREEKYLTHAFGDQYLDYKNKVRRWI